MTTNQDAITDPDLFFRSMDTCPKGPKVLLVNQAGIASTGSWDGKDTWWIGWYPLPKIPPEIREQVERTYKPQSNIGALIGD
jgi:hypothetical protein